MKIPKKKQKTKQERNAKLFTNAPKAKFTPADYGRENTTRKHLPVPVTQGKSI